MRKYCCLAKRIDKHEKNKTPVGRAESAGRHSCAPREKAKKEKKEKNIFQDFYTDAAFGDCGGFGYVFDAVV